MNQEFEQQIPLLPIIIGFIVLFVVSTMARRKLRDWNLRREGVIETNDGRIPSIEERVAAHRAWARGEIKSRGSWFAACLWLLALVWNLTFGVSFFKQLSNPDIKTGGLVMLGLFALGGIPIIGFAVRQTMRQLRFGESLCRVTGKAGVVGKGIKGTIITRTEIQPTGDYKVLLQCIETYWIGTGKNRRSKTEIHFQGSQDIPRTSASSRVGIPFSIDIPNYAPETGYQISRGHINWQLSIRAATDGVDYSAEFVVPVFKLE